MIKKTILIVFLIATMILTNSITFARLGTTGISLYSKNSYTGLIKYNGEDIELEHIVYNYNGKEYPAYSQDYESVGITTSNSYTVDIRNEIYDMSLWRIITNGYPYKSYAQLGCNNDIEAYLATKLAIYNYYYNYDIQKFETSDEFGKNIIIGMQNIINLANNSNNTRQYPAIQILSGSDYEWQLDTETDYLYKIYKVECEQLTDITTQLLLEGDIPEGIIITDTNNQEKEEFSYNDEIKISVPRLNLVRSGNFNIKFTFKCKTLPIYYAESNVTSYAGYLLTDDGIEETSIIQKEYYTKHAAQVHIEVLDAKTKKPLPNVEFELLNTNKEYIKTYKTDENGSLTIKTDVADYYLKQTKVDEEYTMYEDLILLEMRLNKQFGITIILNKKEEIILETEDKNIIITEKEESDNSTNIYPDNDIDIECPPEEQKNHEGKYEQNTDVTIDGSQDDNEQNKNDSAKEEIEKESNEEKNEQTNEHTQTEENEDKKEEITEIIHETENLKKLPRTGM